MFIQAKQSRNGGIVIIDPNGEMHACLDALDLWEALGEVLRHQGDDAVTPHNGTTLVKIQRKGETVVLIDSAAEIYSCVDEDELWEALESILTGERMPTNNAIAVRRSTASSMPPRRTPAQVVTVPKPAQESTPPKYDLLEDVITEMVGDSAVELGVKLIQKLGALSHRGAAPKPGSRRRGRRVRRGDII